MTERFIRLKGNENIDDIMSALFNSGKVKRDSMFITNRTGDILNRLINSYAASNQAMPIKMRKLAVYQNAVNKQNTPECNVLPMSMRKYQLYKKVVNG